jgi:hypothetical protein
LTHLHAREVGFRASECRVVSSSSPDKTYALRLKQVAVIHDVDECQGETILRIDGGHIVRVPYSLEEVLSWLGP